MTSTAIVSGSYDFQVGMQNNSGNSQTIAYDPSSYTYPIVQIYRLR